MATVSGCAQRSGHDAQALGHVPGLRAAPIRDGGRKCIAMGFLRKIFTSVRHEPDTPKPAGERNFQLQEVGFHGDRYLLAVADALLERSDWFIETGTNVASTLRHVARRHPRVLCLSCEPDPEAFAHALSNTEGLPNVSMRNETSQEFLAHLAAEHADLAESQCTLWLDAHGYGFAWPLREEVAYFTTHLASGRMLIDDFLVPGHKEFGYDHYQDQVCSFAYIRGSIRAGLKYDLYYPAYRERTSEHHVLRGWGLIAWGEGRKVEWSDELKGAICLTR
jgi:hypothetical protein